MIKAEYSDLIGYHREGWGTDMYNDGVITYKAKKKSDYHKAFQRLEDELGINVKRVKKRSKADIICKYQDEIFGGWAAGLASQRRRKNGSQYTKLIVVSDKWYSQSTVVHEIGHALGLGHPKDHTRTDTIMSYGAPGDLPWFTSLDLKVLEYLY